MARITSFEVEDCELDFGSYCLGGDFTLCIEGDGHEFELTHAFSCGKRIDGTALALIKEWVSGDLARADKKSLIRQTYNDAILEYDSAEDVACARADHDRSIRLEAAE